MAALNTFIVKKELRPRALTLLCEFIQSQPPHLHLVLETQLSDSVTKCLKFDTSTTVVTLAVTALTMLLPNIPSSLVPHLPNLFNVYARLLFWDRERSLAKEGQDDDTESEPTPTTTDWEMCVYNPEVDGLEVPNLMSYFTVLYGLYPLNFADYIRKPHRYLRHANVPLSEYIDTQPSEIQQRSERFRQYHLLHPNFYSLTVESEKIDFSRWIKSEASEVVAECTALCLATEFGLGNDVGATHDSRTNTSGPSAGNGADASFVGASAILERSASRVSLAGNWRPTQSAGMGSLDEFRTHSTISRRRSQSSHATSSREPLEIRSREPVAGDSPTLPPHLVLSPSHTQLQDMITSNKVIKSGLHQSLANDSVPSLALSHQDSLPEKTWSKLSGPVPPTISPPSAEHVSDQTAQLYRKILLLNNDLNFERYMKQQHMIHIGELRRRQLKEAATEAETQNLLMTNRSLKNRLEKAKRSELQAKRESENRRNLAKKWEFDLSAKLKLLREEQKKWNSEGAALKRDLDAKTEESKRLTKMVCDYETTELNSKQNLEAINTHVEEIARLKAEVDRLIEVEQWYQAKEKETNTRLNEASQAISHAEVLSMKLGACEAELQKAKEVYEGQIADLNTKLQEAQQGGSGTRVKRKGDASKAMESMLAGSRSKQADLQRQYGALLRKYTVLQSSLLDKAANSSASSRAGAYGSSDAEISAIVQGGSISPVRTRSHRGFSSPEMFDKAGDNATGTSVGTVIHRPSTPLSTSSSGKSSFLGNWVTRLFD